MRLQDYLVRQTQKALGDLLRATDALPEDKRDWSPDPGARSALNQLREIADSPRFFIPLISKGAMPEFDDHARKESEKFRQEIQTYEAAKAAAMAMTAELCSHISDFPDEHLDRELTLPFGGGMVMTMAEILGLHQWNIVYHYGQVNYIQTMLGDKDMH